MIAIGSEKKNYKFVIMAILLTTCCFLTYYFHWVLEIGTVFTHFFYVPIILASLWWKRRGLVVATFLAALLIFSQFFSRVDVLAVDNYLRAATFIVIAFVVAVLSEHIAKAESKAKLAYQELDQIFNTAADGMCVINKDFNLLRINKAFSTLCGVGMDEAKGKKCYEVFRDPHCRTDDCLLSRILSGEACVEGEVEKERPDGTRIPCIVAVTPYRRPDGELAGIVELVKDITDLKQTEKELRHSEAQLRLLSQRAINNQEEERARIARELHDELGQELTAFKIEAVSLAERLGNPGVGDRAWKLVNLADQLIETVHRTAANLRPEILDKLGLVRAIQWYAEDFERHTGISCPIDVIDVEDEDITNRKGVATNAYRILQEALTNVLRHAKATQAKVRISKNHNKLVICISDNGVGMDVNKLTDELALGILGMRERASVIGGTLSIKSHPSKGTKVTACLPLS